MPLGNGPMARAATDGAGRFLSAEEPLSGLQIRCGGTVPGTIAIPELRELVGKAQRFGLKLARPILAQDGDDTIRAWVEVIPDAESGGCSVILHSWQATPMPAEEPELASHRRAEIDRALAELTARLDARQCLLTVDSDAADLLAVTTAMRRGIGRPWTDFVILPGSSHRQPLHWRLLDGARVEVSGSQREWRATLIPLPAPSGGNTGFELCLTAEKPLPVPQPSAQGLATGRAGATSSGSSLIGGELAPVLRQPIARIIANAETIRTRLAGPLAEEYSRYAGDIAVAGQHLQSLVDDLADIEVIESVDFTTAPDDIDLVDVARRAAGILGVRAREKGIGIVLPDPASPVAAVAEFRRVLQILLNLVGNAIRYSPENSEISVGFSQDGGRARIVIADQGPGLTEEEQVRIFDKFERLGRSGDGGSGLGLYISRRLARAMGGELSVEGRKGEGARFVLELPLPASR